MCAGLQGFEGLGANNLGGLGMGQGAPQDMAGIMQAMQNPAMQQVVRSVMGQPGMMENIANANPQLRAMMESNPQVRCTCACSLIRPPVASLTHASCLCRCQKLLELQLDRVRPRVSLSHAFAACAAAMHCWSPKRPSRKVHVM